VVAIPTQGRDPTLEAVDAALEASGNAQPARAYLGMSEIGRPCERAIWYGFRWATRSTFDAATLRRFEDGHRSEAIMIERLRAVPVLELYVENPDKPGEQIGCADIGGHFRGHLDGVVVGLLQAPQTPHVWEHKCVNEKKQATLEKTKTELGEKQALAAWDEVYHAQAQCYMHYQGLGRHYLTCDSPGSRSTASVRTDADPRAAHQMIEKARRIITAAEPPARISGRPDWFQCQWCQHRPVCHEPAIPEVNCRTCLHATPELDGDGRWTCARFGCDLTTEHQRMGADCQAHLFVPGLLPWRVQDADPSGWVQYENGTRNGIGGFSSHEIRANPPLCSGADPVLNKLRRELGAEVVG
jgi:hypothetical protein